jgi:hypothetical protein
MLGCAIVCLVAFGAGFGLGRVKNAAKLKAAHNLLDAEEAKAKSAAKALIVKVRAAL